MEDRGSIRTAVRLWCDKFSDGAEQFTYHGLDAFWHASLGVWGAFNDPTGSRQLLSYWNPFGKIPGAATVEINPPHQGINTNVQGVVARAPDGQRWILHQGRLHPAKRRISEEEFDAVLNRTRTDVGFSNGNVVRYHAVANIDADASAFRSQISVFVSQCEAVRQYYLGGSKAAKKLSSIAAIEGLFPEAPGQYEIGPQEAKSILKKHPDVWHKLHKALEAKGIACANGRVERWGPDLRTLSKRPLLFEIKSTESASEVQRAVGQLLLYEKLLGAPHLKVLVYPQGEKSTNSLREALAKLHIHVLSYSRIGRAIRFEPVTLAKCVRHATDES